MAATTQNTDELEVMDLVRQEESVVANGRNVADAFEGHLPPDSPTRKIVEAAFDFTEKMLALQRDFVSELIQVARGQAVATTPAPKRPRAAGRTAKPVRRGLTQSSQSGAPRWNG